MFDCTQVPIKHLLRIVPQDIWTMSANQYLSIEDIRSLGLTDKIWNIWSESFFDLLTKEFSLVEGTLKERKTKLHTLSQELHPNFMRSIHADIDLIKNRVFENGILTIEYGASSYTPFFIFNFATKFLNEFSFIDPITTNHSQVTEKNECSDQVKALEYSSRYLLESDNVIKIEGIKIQQTALNSIENKISPKFLEALKKSSEFFFRKLCENCRIVDLTTDTDNTAFLNKYKHKSMLTIKKDDKILGSPFYIIMFLLDKFKLASNIYFVLDVTCINLYGERDDIQKFAKMLKWQQCTDRLPTLGTLREVSGLANFLNKGN